GMTPTSDFSGFMISSCAFASAAAIAPTDSLDRCMAALEFQDIDSHRPRFRPFRPNAVPGRLFGVLRHQSFELGLGNLVSQMGLASVRKSWEESGPSFWEPLAHDPPRLDAGARWFGAEEARRLATLNAAPELLFRRQKEVLVERIRRYLDLDPFAAAGDNREHRSPGIGDPHVVLELGHVPLCCHLLRERPGQHEFGFEHRAAAFDDAIQRGSHPADHRVANPALDIFEHLPGCALVPTSIEGLSREPKLHE